MPNWSELIRHWQPILDTLPRSSKVLAIGERNGGLSLWLALLGFDVVCSDLKEPTEAAIALHKKYSVAHKIQYKQFDVVNSTEDEAQYDIVIAKSVLGGLKAIKTKSATRNFSVQQQAVQNINQLLVTGGYFFSAENLQGGRLTKWLRRISKKDKGWRHLSYKELGDLFIGFTLVQIKTFGILPTLFSNSGLNACIYFFNKYVLSFAPNESRYISFVVAQK